MRESQGGVTDCAINRAQRTRHENCGSTALALPALLRPSPLFGVVFRFGGIETLLRFSRRFAAGSSPRQSRCWQTGSRDDFIQVEPYCFQISTVTAPIIMPASAPLRVMRFQHTEQHHRTECSTKACPGVAHRPSTRFSGLEASAMPPARSPAPLNGQPIPALSGWHFYAENLCTGLRSVRSSTPAADSSGVDITAARIADSKIPAIHGLNRMRASSINTRSPFSLTPAA